MLNHTNLVTPKIFFSVRVNNRVVEGASQFFGEKDWQKVDDGGKLCEEDWKSAISITVFESAFTRTFFSSTVVQVRDCDAFLDGIPLYWIRCAYCEAMFEDVASVETHINACAGNEVLLNCPNVYN